MKNVKSNKSKKVETLKVETPKIELSEMETLKAKMAELKEQQKAAQAAIKLQVQEMKAKQIAIKEEAKRLKDEEAKILEVENKEKTEKAFSVFVSRLQRLISESNETETTRENISMLLGELPTIAKEVRALLPTTRKAGNGAGTWSGYSAARQQREIAKAISHVERGGDVSELGISTQTSYAKHLAENETV